MAYTKRLKAAILASERSMGNQLGRLAVRRDFSVIRVAKCTGATRVTCYNWFVGGEVSPAYRPAVTRLIKLLTTAKSPDAAWSEACNTFNLVP